MKTPESIKQLSGIVSHGHYGKGSKSEREAVFIDTARGRLLLRRKSGPALDDKVLDKYVGQHVTCDGFVLGSTLLAERITLQP